MKTSKWLAIGVAAAVGAGGLTIITAKADEATTRRPGLRFLQKAKEKLGLTDDQAAKIKGELAAEKDKLTGLLTSLHDARVALRETIQKTGSAESDIRAASAKVATVEADLAVERAKLYGKISPILTPEQLEKASEFQERVDDFIDGPLRYLASGSRNS